VDLRVAHYVGELQEIAHDHRQSDVVLVDLPGIDPWDEAERAGLAHFIQGVRHVMPAVRWHAVLPATWGVRHAALTLEALSELRPEAIAWTHLDEAVDASSILATAVRSHLGPSFLHGDRAGNGATSRAADWQALIDTLRPRRAQATAN
jgi:flagellar biosynthesis GTPase FlhF